ncbi:unnamed protein product [Staurois parvus]|uniref:Uncharacterized protein n=1 Tax=Staurois parvus TaxID=386267 RepID=A0ABN9GH22_9NEOB|nr:unnamed protein product [Staurois parvus]
MAGDAAGDTSWGGHNRGAQGKQRRMVFPECSSGLPLFGTEMLPRATLGNTAKEVNELAKITQFRNAVKIDARVWMPHRVIG